MRSTASASLVARVLEAYCLIRFDEPVPETRFIALAYRIDMPIGCSLHGIHRHMVRPSRVNVEMLDKIDPLHAICASVGLVNSCQQV